MIQLVDLQHQSRLQKCCQRLSPVLFLIGPRLSSCCHANSEVAFSYTIEACQQRHVERRQELQCHRWGLLLENKEFFVWDMSQNPFETKVKICFLGEHKINMACKAFIRMTNPSLKSLYLPDGKHTLLLILCIQGSRSERYCIVCLRRQCIRNILQGLFFNRGEPLTGQITFQAWLLNHRQDRGKIILQS